MKKDEMQRRLRIAEGEMDDLYAEIKHLRQKQELYSRHLILLKRQEENGEELYFRKKSGMDAVSKLARGRAVESAVCEYEELFGAVRWREAQEDFSEIRAMIQKSIDKAEERIQEAERRIYILDGNIAGYKSGLQSLMQEERRQRNGK